MLAAIAQCHRTERAPPRAPVVHGEAPIGRGAAPDAAAPEPDDDAGVGLDDPRLSQIDAAVEAAIAEAKLPGCVVIVGRHDMILWKKAYGARALLPARVPMTLDTVFDVASLTKPVATAASVMVLAERGALSIDDPVVKHIPEFGRAGKGTITLRHLLTHTAGLPADTSIQDYALGREEAIRRLTALSPKGPPGAQFVYSDVGFVVLEEVVRRVTGQDLPSFSKSAVFTPLGMSETGFFPNEALRMRAAPTELRDGAWIQGTVHDPRAFRLGGAAGHAGLFSTGEDLAKFSQSILQDGRGLFGPRTTRAYLAPHDVPGGIRALGWDVQSAFSISRGDALSRRAIGHGGYTGTAMWIDPEKDLFVVFLSNRVHPDGKGAINPLVGKITSLAGRLVGEPCADASDVKPGIDVLRDEKFVRLRGAHVGLITNTTGRATDGTSAIDLLLRAPDVTLVALFAPEHGLGADREGLLDGGVDERSGLPLYSLYGEAFAPSASSLAGIDTLVFDIQDVGTRFYTYASTMRRAMGVAAEHDLRFFVLDRPNPIDGVDVAGPVLDESPRSFVNHHALPVRHGMTMGELAELFNADDHMGVRLQVVRVQGWRRGDYYDETALPWVNPSPNLRSVTEAILYPGVGLLEASNLSVGRGTDTPFEVIGAPWIDGPALAAALTQMHLGGVTFAAQSFEPTSSAYHGEKCGGVRVTVTNRHDLEPVRTGVAIASQLHRLYPIEWHFDALNRMLASRRAMDALLANKPLADVEATWAPELRAFQARREKYLLYPLAASALPP